MMNYRYMPVWVLCQIANLKNLDYKIIRMYKDKYARFIYLDAENTSEEGRKYQCAYTYNLTELTINKTYFAA